MAKEKGKSSRRIKGWVERYRAGDEIGDVAAGRQRLAPQQFKLGSERGAGSEQPADDAPRSEGMVVGVFRRGAYVRIGQEVLFCGIAKTFRAPENASPLAVGDFVQVALVDQRFQSGQVEIDRERMEGMILSRSPRQTALSRPQPRSGKRRGRYDQQAFEKVMAANMEVLLIVASTRQPPLRPRLIERYLIVAERGELKPVLVINKIDIAPPDMESLQDVLALDLAVHGVSAASGEGIEGLQADLVGRRSVLVGASGVGKSTLVNAMVPSAQAATRSVRMKDQRGRHTTSAASVYDLAGGGMLVDTPGVRELGLHIDAAILPWYFPEFDAISPQCRFKDCTHTHEPGCAVIEAVEGGSLSPRRYESYLRLLDSLEENLEA